MHPIRDLLRRGLLLWGRLAPAWYAGGILLVTIFLMWSRPNEIITWIMIADVVVGVLCAVQHRRRGQRNYYGSTGFWLLQLLIGAAYCLNYSGRFLDDVLHGRGLSLAKLGIAVFTGACAVDSWMRRRTQLRTLPEQAE